MEGSVALTAAIFALGLLARAQTRVTRLEEVIQGMAGPDRTVAPPGTRLESRVTWAAAILALAYFWIDLAFQVLDSGLLSRG
jgi:hypothetical protein